MRQQTVRSADPTTWHVSLACIRSTKIRHKKLGSVAHKKKNETLETLEQMKYLITSCSRFETSVCLVRTRLSGYITL